MTTVAVFAVAGVLDLLMPQPQVAEIRSGFAEREAPVTVRVGAVPGAPSETADEAYVLDVSPTGVTVTASTPQGERYAHATLEQLKDLSDGRLPCCRVVDWPRLKWRGFMNDCGKNFLEVEGIKAILDVMAAYKMNLFHWHLTDYQGWRLESKKYPQLQKPESFTRQIGRFYTQDEFRDIVAYAKERGITVMPELDVPGHTLAYRRAMGIDSMSADGTDKVVAGLFEELCSLADEKTMPFIHLGTDEARLESEKCGAEWPNLWACAVNRCGRKAVVWAPGIRLAKDIDSIEMAWHDTYVTNAVSPVIDASRMYHASWDPFDVLSHVAFTRPCRWTETNAQQLGAVTCCWHDDNMGDDTMKRFRECMMIPSIVGFAENYWTGRNEDRPEFIKRLPAPGTPAFAFVEALERRMIAQRDRVIAKRWPDLPFPFVAQTRMRWSVRDAESGSLLATDVPQGTVWAYNERAKDNALIDVPVGGVVYETWIKSHEDRTIGCWIDCVKVHGEYGRDGVARMPAAGEWSAEGAEVLVNGEAVAPPEWKQPGLAAKERIDVLERDVPYMNDLLETPMVDELFTLRPPVPVQFKKGWNHIVVRLPKKAKRLRASTGMTFCPIEGISEHPREVSDFEYSAAPPLHAFVQQWGDNLIRGHDTGRSFRDIPVSEGHFYHVKTTPKVDGDCRFLNGNGEVAGEVRLSERDAFYPPFGATAAELALDADAEVRFYEDPEPPKTPVPDPNAVPYEDRPQGQPTGRWQREIDVVAEKGGGTVRVPSGVWHVKPLRLRSNVTLELDEGAVLLASVDPLDYEQEPRRRAFVYAENATNVTIRGRGTLDGRGYVFRETGKNMDGASQPQALPKLMCFNRCRNVTLEDFTYRRGGAWGCHLCNCDGVTMRRVTCFNHVNNTNDGVDIESRNVLIEDCDIDADDDAIAVKSESDPCFAVTNIVIRNCRLASMAYPFKIGTGSYGDVSDILVENCAFPRTKMNHRFPWSKLVAGITNDISGICGIGIQCVDGGRLEDVTIRNVDIEGYGVPLSIRLGRRHLPGPGKETYLRNVLVENVKAVAEGPTASSIVGAEGLEVENVTLRNVRIKLAGGVTAADVGIVYPNDKGYPGPNMFRSILPVCGLYCRHVRGIKTEGLSFSPMQPDERPFVAGLEEACRELEVPDVGGRCVVRVQPDGADKCVVSFRVPISDVQQIWTPDMIRPFVGRKWWLSKASAPQSSMPCIAYFNMAERNRFFFGAAALEWDCLLESKIDQELGVYHVRLTVSAGEGRSLRPFDVTIDRRDVSWTQAVDDWRNSLPYARGSYPDGAWKPAYCTWYAAHAAISEHWVERVAPIAADLGFGTFILDDGWSYDEAKRVNPETIKTWYRDVGRWDSFSTAKFPDFKKHRERIRGLGMNYIVWVAPYFLGTRSDAFRRWGYDRRRDVKVVEGNALTDIEDRPMMESVTEQLVRLLRDCDLDGLKIDFIDYIPPSVETPHGARTLEYVSDLMGRLRKVRPDGIFEFRQSYATPMTANLATQFRAEDVPFEWLDNLARMAQIRLTMGDGVPIHSDPIFWAESETRENVNRHFMAAMAGVPMLSMDLVGMSPEYRAVVRKWVRFYKEKVSQFHRHGKWRVFYRNGGLVGLVSVLEEKSFVIVNDPAGFETLLSACGEGELTVCNVGFEPVTLADGTVVAPADSYPASTMDGILTEDEEER